MPMSDYYLPEDIIQSILLRLPPKSLIRCTLVCKSWISLIKSSTFIQSHLFTTIDSNNKSDHHLLLLRASSYERPFSNCLHWDTPEFNEHSMLPDPVTFLEHRVEKHKVVGTCNGLICLAPDPDQYDERHTPPLIWNPCIRKIVVLPTPPATLPEFSNKQEYYWIQSYGFGYDSRSNDYKVLRIKSHSRNSAPVAQVYSLAKGSWKTLDASVGFVKLQYVSRSFVFVSGCLHTLEVLELSDDDDCYFLASFDMSTELFGEITMPKALVRGACSISKYAGSLALIKYKGIEIGMVNNGCDVWVMKEYGVAESWTYLYKIDVNRTCICGFKRCGEVVLSKSVKNKGGRSGLASVFPQSKKFKVSGNYDYKYYFMDSFVESLILLDHSSATSY